MKKLVLFLLIAVCRSTSLFSSHYEIESSNDNYEKITLQQFSQLLYQGASKDQLKNLLVECPAGSELPFRFTLRGEIFSFEPSKDVAFSIKLLKTCYLKYEPKMGLVLSVDLKNWKKFENFFVGKAAASFTNENQVPTANLEIELNEQTHRWEVPFGQTANLCNCKTQYYYNYRTYPEPSYTVTPW